MLVYNIGFTNSNGDKDETQINIEKYENPLDEVSELLNLILSLREEMDIKDIEYIYCVGEEDETDV